MKQSQPFAGRDDIALDVKNVLATPHARRPRNL